MIPSLLWQHITIDEINSLTEEESDMLLYICNVLYPIKLPECKEEYHITLNLIRHAKKPTIINRVIQACSVITEEGKPTYNGLRSKLGLPVPQESGSLSNAPTTGSAEEIKS